MNFEKSGLFRRYPQLLTCKNDIEIALSILIGLYEGKGKLLVMGNGGSSADAEHFCGELMKGFISKRPLNHEKRLIFKDIDERLAENLQEGLPAISLGVSHSLISAFANDCDWNYVFAQQVFVLASSGDVLFGISTSGNSKNIVNGAMVAKALGVKTIGLTGELKSQLSDIADVTIRVPGTLTHEVQELHLPIYHALALELESYFYDK